MGGAVHRVPAFLTQAETLEVRAGREEERVDWHGGGSEEWGKTAAITLQQCWNLPGCMIQTPQVNGLPLWGGRLHQLLPHFP